MLMKTDDVMGICWAKEPSTDEWGIGFMGNVQRDDATNSTTGQYMNLACGEGGTLAGSCPFAVQYGFNNGQFGRDKRSDAIYTLSQSGLGSIFKRDSFAEYVRISSYTWRAYVPAEDFWPGRSGAGVYTWGTGYNSWKDNTRNKDVMMFDEFSTRIPGRENKTNEAMTPLVGWRNNNADAIATVCIHFTGYANMNAEIMQNAGMFFMSINGLRYNPQTAKMQWNGGGLASSILGHANWVWCSEANGTKPPLNPATDSYGIAGVPTLMVMQNGSLYEYFLTAYVRMARRGVYAALDGDDHDTCHTFTMPSFAWKSATLPSNQIKVNDSWIVINPRIF